MSANPKPDVSAAEFREAWAHEARYPARRPFEAYPERQVTHAEGRHMPGEANCELCGTEARGICRCGFLPGTSPEFHQQDCSRSRR